MCGRKYASEELTWAEYRDILDITGERPASNFQPNMNICPTQSHPVCFEQDGSRELQLMRWGLIPHWAKEPGIGAKMINARAETLEEKPSFKPLLKDNRCAIMVSGFYEWTGPKGNKQAHLIRHIDSRPMIFAGLWTNNKRLDLSTYTIITAAADSSFEYIHHRKPAVLERDTVGKWLNGPWDEARQLTAPYYRESFEIKPCANPASIR